MSLYISDSDTSKLEVPLAVKVLDNYVSRKEFAKQVSRDERTVIRWEILRRAPKRTKIGRSVYYSKESIQQWLQEREQG